MGIEWDIVYTNQMVIKHGQLGNTSMEPQAKMFYETPDNPRQRPVFQESFIKSETSARVGTGFSIMPWISGFEAHSKVQANLVKSSAVIGTEL
jgi:hypothetical protein